MAIRKSLETDDKDLRELILTNELGNQMLNMVAPVYDKSAVVLYLFQALGIVLSKEVDFIPDMVNQMFPQTATWGLKYWEYEYGITPDESKSIEQRRKYLMSVLYKDVSMTPKRLEQIVEGITNLPCEIVENIEPNTFLVTIRGYYADIQTVKDSLNKKSPAHLNYIINQAELTELEVNSALGAAITEYEHYELEVLN